MRKTICVKSVNNHINAIRRQLEAMGAVYETDVNMAALVTHWSTLLWHVRDAARKEGVPFIKERSTKLQQGKRKRYGKRHRQLCYKPKTPKPAPKGREAKELTDLELAGYTPSEAKEIVKALIKAERKLGGRKPEGVTARLMAAEEQMRKDRDKADRKANRER